MRTNAAFIAAASLLTIVGACRAQQPQTKPAAPAQAASTPAPDTRMDWWREARFGMFIHWGLYAIPAGEWNGRKTYGEWIRNDAHIPVNEYEKFKEQFNPVKFDADAWVSLAKAAGMKYIVITTKHHDGFCLFDSKQTDWDVMSTPFHRDIMKEMAEACRKQGITICWYHSIMDWHHPDYLPRREWEKDRPTEGAEASIRFDKVPEGRGDGTPEPDYGPIGVMWFDGAVGGNVGRTAASGWTWRPTCGSCSPTSSSTNRVDKGGGQFGMTKSGLSMRETSVRPSREIPPTGFPGVDWETCMTMNDHWGYNKNDHNFKSSEDLIRKLADIASKGGNFLLNVGPTAAGEIPPESVGRLHDLAKWMEVNGDSIHGTQAGPFEKLDWGRCTQAPVASATQGLKTKSRDTRLYLHVFQWPKDSRLVIPGLSNEPVFASLLADPKHEKLAVSRRGADVVILLPHDQPDKIDSVVVLEIEGKPDVATQPIIESDSDIFVGEASVTLKSKQENVQLRYTLDGLRPYVGEFSRSDRAFQDIEDGHGHSAGVPRLEAYQPNCPPHFYQGGSTAGRQSN